MANTMADIIKAHHVGEYFQKYNVCVGREYPNDYIDDEDYNQDMFVESDKTIEIKVDMLTAQNVRIG